jgi:thymidylate synthase (FAD)
MTEVRVISSTPNPEEIIERIGRICYNSEFRGGEDGRRFIRTLIKNGHLSVIEHAYATIIFRGISRAMSHQLVRHRLTAVTQASQRYIDQTAFNTVLPPTIQQNNEALRIFEECKKRAKGAYVALRELKIPKEDARYVLPNACDTTVVMSADFNEWRHIFSLRCEKHAQWEIRECMTLALRQMNSIAPSVFGDLHEMFLGPVKGVVENAG